MNRLPRALLSVAVGVVVFLGVTIAVTEGLAPYVWPSLMVGVPAGGVAGVAAVPLAVFGLAAWAERRQTGRVSERTRRNLSTTAAALGGFVVGSALAFAVAMTQAIGLATAMLVAAMPAGLFTAAVAGILVARRHRRLARASAPPSTDVE
jgi:cytochrome bd-type quinol oxidase subunit 2